MSIVNRLFGASAAEDRTAAPNRTFILEPVLTPSGILDGGDDTPDPVAIAPPLDLEDIDLPEDLDVETTDLADVDPDGSDPDLETNINADAEPPEVDADLQEATLGEPDLEEELPFFSEDTSENPEAGNPEQSNEPLDDLDTVADLPETNLSEEEELPFFTGEEVDEVDEIDAEEAEAAIAPETSDADTEIEGETETETGSDVDAIAPENIPEIDTIDWEFHSGTFTVGETGQVGIDYLFDGGSYKGELALFSLEGMEQYNPDSPEFIAEAARRALSDSELGYVVISDATEAARFGGHMPGENADWNAGEYRGVRTVQMRPGDTFGVMLVPNGRVAEVLNNPAIDGAKRPLFSMATANPDDGFHVGQITDLTGDGNTFVMEDKRVDGMSDKDYNDVIFQVRGATGRAPTVADVTGADAAWKTSDLGRAITEYAIPYISPETEAVVEVEAPEVSGEAPEVEAPEVEAPEVEAEVEAEAPEVAEPDTETDTETVAETPDTPEGEEAIAETPAETPTDPLTDIPDTPTAEELPDLQNPADEAVEEAIAETPTETPTDPLTDIPDTPTTEELPDLQNPADEAVEEAIADIPLPTTLPEFPPENQPLIGIIDTGVAANNIDIDYGTLILGSDRVDGDDNPLLAPGEGNEHGTHVLGIIAAQQDNGEGIDGINDDAPIWVGRAIGSGEWAESLVEFVDAAKESAQPNAVVNLSLDLTQIDAEGNVTTRYELTPLERAAIEYARQHNVLLVVAAGNDGGVMSALGQASQEFDNILTVGAAEQFDPTTSVWQGADRTAYSSYGNGLDVMAYGGTTENPELSLTGDGLGVMAGTSVATAKVTGAVSQVWAANPDLSYRQVIEIIKNTATDLGTSDRDLETGAGLVNLTAAVLMAKVTEPQANAIDLNAIPETWSGEGVVTPSERAADPTTLNTTPTSWRSNWWNNGWFPGWTIPKSEAEKAIAATAAKTPWLGASVGTAIDLGNGFLQQRFERGYILWNGKEAIAYATGTGRPTVPIPRPQPWWGLGIIGFDGTKTHPTYIRTFFRNGSFAKLGSPTGNVRPWAGGYTQNFAGGSEKQGAIMKSNVNDNSYWVGGEIWNKFLALGGAEYVGYPSTDAIPVKGGLDGSGGSVQHFRGGKGIPSKIWLSKHGAYPTWGAIGGRYDQLGGSQSFLGFPTSREQGIGNGWVKQDFEGGYILWHPQYGTTVYDTKAIDQLPPDSGKSSTSDWHVQFWDNKDLVGTPDWSRYEEMSDLRFHAGLGAPVGTRGIPEDQFSGRWITTSYFDGGLYDFVSQADDGVRVFVDGELVIDKWNRSEPWAKYTARVAVEPGYHQVMVEYYEDPGVAGQHLYWQQVDPAKEWIGEFFPNKSLEGSAVGAVSAGDGFLDRDWGAGREPGINMPSDRFSDRWTTTRYFEEAGVYEFTANSDDGLRVWIDDRLVFDEWGDLPTGIDKFQVSLKEGYHKIRVEHRENGGLARNQLSWEKLPGVRVATNFATGEAIYAEPWVGAYFNNTSLSGVPTVTRMETQSDYLSLVKGHLNLDFGNGSPDNRISTDNFSSRWTKQQYLDEGTYKFHLKGDDGMRLYVNGELLVDRWNDPPFVPHEVEVILPKGTHTLEVEYVEQRVLAYASLDWDRVAESSPYAIAPEFANAHAKAVAAIGAETIGVPISHREAQVQSNIPIGNFWLPALRTLGWTQEFRGTQGPAALLQKVGGTPTYTFGAIWEAYRQAGGAEALGYPVASQKDLGNGAYELELPNGRFFWAPGMTNATYYAYTNQPNNTLTIPADAWRGEYFANRDWSGDPLVIRQDSGSGSALNKDWHAASPAPGLPQDNFSVQWTSQRPFDRGTYRFNGNHDDGFTIEVNGQKPIDKMVEVAALTTGYGTFTHSDQYPITVKHREYGGLAQAKLSYQKASDYVLGLDANNNPSIELPDAFAKHGGYDRVGLPINDVHLWGNGYVQDFDGGANGRGILMRRHNTQTFYYVFGSIWNAYFGQGGAEGWMGYPTSDPFPENGLLRQNFEQGYITSDGVVHRPSSGNPGNEIPLHSNPTESNPLRGFSHPLAGKGTLTQGWNTNFSHKGASAYAMDFDAYFGAPVYAMRSGRVIKVIGHFADDGRNDPSLANKANLVYIDHGSGYVSRYLHLKQNSVVVKEGDLVVAGQKIAAQGNSGWSTASHLHVAVHNAQGNSVPFEIPGVNP